MAIARAELIDRLVAARAAAGHTQEQCAAALVSLGAPPRSQASISRYLSGKQAVPVDTLHAISEYINTFEPESADDASSGGGADADKEPVSDFAGMVRRLTDEPLLGPRQAALVDALIERLRSGPPLSADDSSVVAPLMRMLGLGSPER